MATVAELETLIKSLKSQLKTLTDQLENLSHHETKEIKGIPLEISDKQNTDKIIILPDSSWLVANLDIKDSHHIAAESSLGALLPYNPLFHVPIFAAIETMSRLIRVNNITVSNCKKLVLDFLVNKLHAKGARNIFDFREIINRYNLCSRKEIKKLTAIDFYIVTEGMGLGAKILTCDVEMYKRTKKYYNNIYFMTDKVPAHESDLSRLIHDLQSPRKK
jgi:hypothetical protein